MSVDVGTTAPDFTLKDQDNEDFTLSEHRGHPVVLMFYPLDFSPTCTGELRDITATAERFDAAGAEVVGVSVDSRWAHAAFREREGIKARLLADFQPRGAVAQLYGCYLEQAGIATRGTFVIDAEGVVRHRILNKPSEARSVDEVIEATAACAVG